MPMMTSASSTLTAAMMPSNRLVVPSSLPMTPLERRRLMRSGETRRLMAAFADRIVQQLPAFVGDAGRLLHGRSEAHELAREILERRLDLPAHPATLVGEEQIAGDAADHRADDCRCDSTRVVHQASYPDNSSYKLYATHAAAARAIGAHGSGRSRQLLKREGRLVHKSTSRMLQGGR